MKMRKIAISIIFGILFTITLIYIPTSFTFNITELKTSINGYGTFFAISTLSIAYTFYKLYYSSKYKIKFNIHLMFTSLFLAIFLLLGKYYIHSLSIQDLYKNVPIVLVNFIMLIVFFISLYITMFNLFEYLNNLKISKKSSKETSFFSKFLDFILEKHSFLIPFFIILICGLPYIISFYPGTVQQDGNNQLQQFLGNYGKTSHHPYVSTIILGTCFKIGSGLGNDNLGIFTFTFLQFLFSSFVFAYTINFMKKIKAPMALRFLTLIYFSIFTIWPINAYTFVKDTVYYLIFVLIVIKLFQYVTTNQNQNSILFNITLYV